MPREPIPEDLRRFILTSVPSVPFVEALLIFREAQGTPVTVDLLARRLVRLVAYALIIVAIVGKNRSITRKGP